MRRALFRTKKTGLAFNSMGTCKHYDVTRSYIHIVKPLDADIQKGYVTAITSISSSGENQTDQKGETAAACEINIGGVDSVGKADGRDTGRVDDRSTVIATYTDVHNKIRTIYTRTQYAKAKWYGAGHFSYNTGKLCCHQYATEPVL